MKKYIILIFFACLINKPLWSQMGRLIFENDFTVIDTVRLEILYQFDFIEDTTRDDEKLTDQQVLQIGFHSSKYFSKLLFTNDSINTILEEQNAKNLFSPPQAAAMYEMIRDKKAKTYEVTYRSDDMVFRYSEDIPEIRWVIENDRKTIREYSCQKATTTFRGRKYEAWFTPEIPIREGPYKFGGLPGLILEMQDSQSHFVYTCAGIKKTKEPMKIRNWKYTETTRKELNQFLIRKFNNLSGYYKSRGTTMFIHRDSKFIEAPEDYSVPHNPIELE